MVTNRDDDYLICKHYYEHIGNKSKEFQGFSTFEHNENHYFSWNNGDKVIFRSEAYPDEERTLRGIKAVLKNKDLPQRYSVDTQHGVHFLVLWGGGDHQAHTGNMNSHNEIGRSCPAKSKEELHSMLLFMGKDFANKVVPLVSDKSTAAAAIGAAATAATAIAANNKSKENKTSSQAKVKPIVAAAAASRTTTGSTGANEGFKWWYLLPLLLIPLFFMWKGCGDNAKVEVPTINTETSAISTPVTNEESSNIASENEAKVAAEAQAKIEAEAALVSERIEAEKKLAEEKLRKSRVASGGRSSDVSYEGNKSSGF